MEGHGTLQNIQEQGSRSQKEGPGRLWKPCGTSWNLVEGHGIVWKALEPYGKSWNIMEGSGTFQNAD